MLTHISYLSNIKYGKTMVKRILESHINALLETDKAIIIMGARQVGKSTLLTT